MQTKGFNMKWFIYHPRDGHMLSDRNIHWTASNFRKAFPSTVWKFDPWTGQERDTSQDPYGLALSDEGGGLGECDCTKPPAPEAPQDPSEDKLDMVDADMDKAIIDYILGSQICLEVEGEWVKEIFVAGVEWQARAALQSRPASKGDVRDLAAKIVENIEVDNSITQYVKGELCFELDQAAKAIRALLASTESPINPRLSDEEVIAAVDKQVKSEWRALICSALEEAPLHIFYGHQNDSRRNRDLVIKIVNSTIAASTTKDSAE